MSAQTNIIDPLEALASADGFLKSGQKDLAVSGFLALLAQNPDYRAQIKSRLNTLYKDGALTTCTRLSEGLLKCFPDCPEAMTDHVMVLTKAGKFKAALELIETVNQRVPGNAFVMGIYANLLRKLGRYTEAIDWSDKALALDPTSKVALNTRGVARLETAQYRLALDDFNLLLTLSPGDPRYLWNLGTTLLHIRPTLKAWQHFESRYDIPASHYNRLPSHSLPLLRYESPKGKRLLVTWEARLGDALQMLRFVPQLQSVASSVTVQLPDTLQRLVSRSHPNLLWVGVDQSVEADFRVPFQSLPLATRSTSARQVSLSKPLFTVSEKKMQRWVDLIKPDKKPLVAFSWRGRPDPPHRTVPIEAFAPLLALSNFHFVSMQLHPTLEERRFLSQFKNVTVLNVSKTSLDDIAALMQLADNVVTIDSALVHLAGSLLRPTSVLLKFGADWRWQGRQTAWYPSVKMFKQLSLGEWHVPMDELVESFTKTPNP